MLRATKKRDGYIGVAGERGIVRVMYLSSGTGMRFSAQVEKIPSARTGDQESLSPLCCSCLFPCL